MHRVTGRVSRSDALYGAVLDRILSGELAIGAQLPSESEFCDAFGVSRPVVRQALLRLKADGLITTHQGLGSFVTHQPDRRIRQAARAQDIASYLRCQEVRLALESDIARHAALRRDAEQLAAIEAAHEAFAASARAGRIDAGHDLAFHRQIAAASGNEFHLDVLDGLLESMSGFMRLTVGLTRASQRPRAQRVIDEHAAICAAIRDGDAEAARVAMQFHLIQARRRLTRQADEPVPSAAPAAASAAAPLPSR